MGFKRPYRKVVYRKKVNILLVQIVNRNLGDAVIADNAEYLIRQALPRLSIRHYVLQRYDIKSEDYERIKAADLIIFAGGGLVKYKQEKFHVYVPQILECAQAHDIPVFFNSVGVEGYDPFDERCRRLAQALNFPCVKGISVRDDLNTLVHEYINTGHAAVSSAVDCAVFTPQVYGIQRDTKSDVIGLGIVRYRIFEDYGIPQVTREVQLKMWKGIALELEARGYRWQLFVNGLRSDYDFALEVLEYMGRREQAGRLLAERPVTGRELVETTASYAGVIACRMHANIIAYALGIPSIGLVWNDKMVFWGERIGYPQRFLQYGQFDPALIVQSMTDSMREGVVSCSSAMKACVQKPLAKFIRQYGSLAWKKNRRVFVQKPVKWADKLAAAALGGMHMQYTNMNTLQGLEQSLQSGFQNLEADIRLTKDGRLVCVNGWSKGTYEKLGVDPKVYGEDGMDYDTFMKCRMYDGHYGTMDAVQLFARMKAQEGSWRLILDIGRPKKEVLDTMLIKLRELCADGSSWQGRLFIRLQTRYDVETVQAAQLPVQVVFYVPPKQERTQRGLTLESIAKYCKKQGVQWVSMPKEAVDDEVMAYLRKQKLKSCIFSYNTYTEAVQAVMLGADLAATSFLSVADLEDWYESKYTVVIR